MYIFDIVHIYIYINEQASQVAKIVPPLPRKRFSFVVRFSGRPLGHLGAILGLSCKFAIFSENDKKNRMNSTFKGRNKKSRDLAVLPRRDEAGNDLQKILRAEF